jgi:hypothetical protein
MTPRHSKTDPTVPAKATNRVRPEKSPNVTRARPRHSRVPFKIRFWMIFPKNGGLRDGRGCLKEGRSDGSPGNPAGSVLR